MCTVLCRYKVLEDSLSYLISVGITFLIVQDRNINICQYSHLINIGLLVTSINSLQDRQLKGSAIVNMSCSFLGLVATELILRCHSM